MQEKLTLVQHLEELRKRIIICLIVVFACGIFCFFYTDKILSILSNPVGKLIFLKPTEAFLAKIKLSFYGGIFISMPVIIYQIWKFLNPGLIEIERRYFLWIMPFSYLLFLSGVLFAFFAVLPVGMKFLLGYGTENITPMISVGSYISFVGIFLIAFGIVFQLPVVVLFLTKLGIVTPKWLSVNRKYAILIIFILSGILTPGPDIFSQFLMAIPTLLLYEISILLSKLISPATKIGILK
ncbi:MAG: twin-arginine translocase subunit TatC [Elusimicrobiota bacterium]|nr:twin-arginine translocase subunit TatC [Elusimicrobiota bacterium]